LAGGLREAVLDAIGGGGRSAELTVVAVAPAHHAMMATQRARVIADSRDLDHAASPGTITGVSRLPVLSPPICLR
jgi:hypothetical protein